MTHAVLAFFVAALLAAAPNAPTTKPAAKRAAAANAAAKAPAQSAAKTAAQPTSKPTTRPTPHDPEVPNDFAIDYDYSARINDQKAMIARMHTEDATCDSIAADVAANDISNAALLSSTFAKFGKDGRDRIASFLGDHSPEDLGTPTVNGNLATLTLKSGRPISELIFIGGKWKLDVHATLHSKLGRNLLPFQKKLRFNTERNTRIASALDQKVFPNVEAVLEALNNAH